MVFYPSHKEKLIHPFCLSIPQTYLLLLLGASNPTLLQVPWQVFRPSPSSVPSFCNNSLFLLRLLTQLIHSVTVGRLQGAACSNLFVLNARLSMGHQCLRLGTQDRSREESQGLPFRMAFFNQQLNQKLLGKKHFACGCLTRNED